jgi:exosortase E/protease (VPEID-CTERM system)
VSDLSSSHSAELFTQNAEPLSPGPPVSGRLARRILFLSLLFAAELLTISIWLDGNALLQTHGLTRLIGERGAWTLRAVVGFAIIFFGFAFLEKRAELRQLSALLRVRIAWSWLGLHTAAFSTFAALSAALYQGGPYPANLLAALWLISGTAAIACGALAFFPFRFWSQLPRITGWLWAYALGAVLVGCSLGKLAQAMWRPASAATFALVKIFLKPLVPVMIANPARLALGTPRFAVAIAPACSGLEGMGLMLAFVLLWLFLFRRECRFPRSLLLVPAAVGMMFLLNAVRICALILIGNAGARQIALRGFHSEAGWLFFNVAALAVCVSAGRIRYFAANNGGALASPENFARENPTAVYLVPFLALLAAGMLAGAASSGFEWLYPFRFFAAAAALWVFRKHYAKLDWRCGWLSPIIGALIFLLWIALARFPAYSTGAGMPTSLASASASARTLWIAFRVLASVTTVPLAEELAFRGYLLRRLISSDFEAVSFSRVTPVAVLVSSAIFGLLHGGRWIAGILAGIVLALLIMRRGRIGDAVAAHAVANGLIALYVLAFNAWSLW